MEIVSTVAFSCLGLFLHLHGMHGLGIEEIVDVFENVVDHRHEHQGDGGGEDDAEAEAEGHGDEELGLHAGLEDHRRQAEEGGQCGEQDGAEAAFAGVADGGAHGNAGAALSVDQIDHDQGVVDHHTGEGDDAEEREDAHVFVHEQVAGHLLMDKDMSILSFFGIVALTGVVVNDSLIMIDLINRERRAGIPMGTAIRDAGKRRFRPILLTTLTTFLGLSPMIFETSVQAQFLIPMALSLGFGIVFATAVTLVLVPVIYNILEDIHDLFDPQPVHSVEVEKETEAGESNGRDDLHPEPSSA